MTNSKTVKYVDAILGNAGLIILKAVVKRAPIPSPD